MKKLFVKILPAVIVLAVVLLSCKKDRFITSRGALLSTSVDSLKYDTVFTSIGSVTQSFKINNLNNQKLLLSSVRLMGGAASAFKININGLPSPIATGIELAANDSMYIFVTVQINPNLSGLPFIVKDSIQIIYNGNIRYVQLEAFGQNANFLRNKVITGNVSWPNNLPYVILGSVRVDTTASLTIDPGCRIYLHADAPFIVDGTLIVNGTKNDSVVFNGDRLDAAYKDLPASWPGIYFRGKSKNNVLTHAFIKNAYQAVVTEQPSINSNPKLTLNKCVIDNAFDVGLFAVNSSIKAENCLISNCGNNISIAYGGDYNFSHCTVAGYSTDFITHQNQVLAVKNFAAQNGVTVTADITAAFTNCIFWGDNGNLSDEIAVQKQGSNPFTVSFDNCLYRMSADPLNSIVTDNIRNQDPLFDSINVNKGIFDFHLTKNAAAPGVNTGKLTPVFSDLDDNIRPVGLPDIGCYEKQ